MDDVAALLRESGARVTAARVGVLGALLRAGRPVSQPELVCLPELDGCDRVTLYRTLKRLRQVGLAHAVQGVDGSWRFCAHAPGLRGCPGNHPHFLCLACGAMACLTPQALPRVEVPRGAEVHGKQLVVYGRCPACAAGEPRSAARRRAGPSGGRR